MVAWPIRGNQPLSPFWSTCPPLSLSFSPISVMIKSCLPLQFLPPSLQRRPIRSAHRGSPAVDERLLEVSTGDEQWWSSSWSSKFTPPPAFLANFSAVRPPFLVRPPILEQAFDPLQNHTPLDCQIIAVEKSIAIHTVPSRIFSVNRDSFMRWDPPKLDVLFISFRLLAMFWESSEITLYEIELSIWVLPRFACRTNRGSKLKTETTSRLISTPRT